jgi:membrane-bound lytic murein transglycosylase
MRGWLQVVRTGLLLAAASQACCAQVDTKWKIHDPSRPVPPVVDPGTASAQDAPGRPPADAVVLFDGKDLSKWAHKDGSAAKWKVENGYAEVVAKTGYIYTREAFGDCQLHVEFAEPVPPKGESQERGNSGVFLMGLYEIQVLDSYENKTYADGQAAAIYGQYPPLVNASRPPGEWQTYDIIFHGPRFDASGKLTRPARATVFHNGVLVQDNVELSGPTAHGERPPYKQTPEKLPLALQDHGNPVRYRNIWTRELKSPG